MSASSSFAKTIMVGLQYHHASCMFALTSAELPGLLLAGKDPAQLWADVSAVVKALYKVGCNMDVEVTMERQPTAEDVSFIPLQPSLLKVEPRVS